MNCFYKKVFLFITLFNCLPAFAIGVIEPPPLSLDNISNHLDVLASRDDARIAGFPGEQQAADYISETMEDMGYSVRRQVFPITAFKRDDPQLLLHYAGNDYDISATAFLYCGGTGGESQTFSLINVGAGSAFEFSGISDDFPIAALLRKSILKYRDAVSNAQQAGVDAVVFYNDTDRNISGTLVYPFTIPVLGVNKENGDLLKAAAEEGSEIVITNDTIITDSESLNIIAEPQGWDAAAPFLIIGAHFDSLDTPGANDNASGVVMLFEIARIIRYMHLPYQVRFIFFGAEEIGLIGSAYYTDKMKNKGICIGMINLDVIAEGTYIKISSSGPKADSSFVKGICDLVDSGFKKWEFDPDAYSDQQSFVDAGIPAFMISAAPLTTYHTDLDTIDNMNLEIMYKIGSTLLDYLDVLNR